MRQRARHRVPWRALGAALPTPRVVLDDAALDHRPIWLETLPNGLEAELVETAERGQVGRGEGSVVQVEVFRRMSSVGTSILEDLDVYPRTSRPPPTTPSTAKSPISRRRDAAGCIVHSDRGSQFRSRKFVHALTRHHLIGSMGQVGAAGDNAAMESFFSLLQKNVLDRKRWRTREELRIAIITWIERTYHRRRRQARLGRLTPIEYETIMNPVALAA